MPDLHLHERPDFKPLLETVAQERKVNEPALVEKDYWIMRALRGLKDCGLHFQLKGGTSLSKGFGIIHRFSEDIDIHIESFDDIPVSAGPNQDKPAHIESRKTFIERLAKKIAIPGITSVTRDTEFDDEKFRNAGLRLNYDTHFDAVPGLKSGILLEVGFDQTSPHQAVAISSWALDFARDRKLSVHDGRATDILCYNPEYTFVEKLQTVIRKFRQFKESGSFPRNFIRHYYDIHQLLDLRVVQAFIGTAPYAEHKRKRFKSENQNLSETDAFKLEDAGSRALFEKEYAKTAALYFKGQVPLTDILKRISRDLARL
jgi:hypothetical protein